MGFLDNSGDIILDAVLTDLGRERMARGDGSFRIKQFAVGDDEIDYGKYDKGNLTGSLYYDLDILNTPILEAFTDNAAQLKSKLVTMARNDLLYLPILKLVNGTVNDGKIDSNNAVLSDDNVFYVTSDITTSTTEGTLAGSTCCAELYVRDGVIRGDGITNTNLNTSMIVIDQGLDTTEIPQTTDLDADLRETQYIIEIDDRLGQISHTPQAPNQTIVDPNFIDDDRIASYYFSLGTSAGFVGGIGKPNPSLPTIPVKSVIRGPLGTRLRFAIRASTELRSSSVLFDRLGFVKTGLTLDSFTYSGTFKCIDTIVRVTGVTTGYRIDVPVRFVKKTA